MRGDTPRNDQNDQPLVAGIIFFILFYLSQIVKTGPVIAALCVHRPR